MSELLNQFLNFPLSSRELTVEDNKEPIFIHYNNTASLFYDLLLQFGLQNKFKFINQTSTIHSNQTYYLLIRISRIEMLVNPTIIVNNDLLWFISKNKNVSLIYDLSGEAITFSNHTSRLLITFHQLLEEYNIDNHRVTLMCANANANKCYSEWATKNNITNQIKMIGYHFYLFTYAWEVSLCKWFKSHNDGLQLQALKSVTQGTKRSKYFMCLNLRPRAHRTALMLHLLQRNHMDKGLITYFGDEFANEYVDNESEKLHFISQLKSHARLIPQLKKLNELTPLLFDKDANKIKKDLWERGAGQVEFLFPESNLSNEGIDSYFEIVTETWLTDHLNLYITEKTIRPILRLQPFIHVGSPRLLANLRSIGFQTFSPYIDESYDEILDPHERLEMIFHEIDRLCSMSLDEIHQLYCDLWPRLLHNQQFFLKKIPALLITEIQNNILSKLSLKEKA